MFRASQCELSQSGVEMSKDSSKSINIHLEIKSKASSIDEKQGGTQVSLFKRFENQLNHGSIIWEENSLSFQTIMNMESIERSYQTHKKETTVPQQQAPVDQMAEIDGNLEQLPRQITPEKIKPVSEVYTSVMEGLGFQSECRIHSEKKDSTRGSNVFGHNNNSYNSNSNLYDKSNKSSPNSEMKLKKNMFMPRQIENLMQSYDNGKWNRSSNQGSPMGYASASSPSQKQDLKDSMPAAPVERSPQMEITPESAKEQFLACSQSPKWGEKPIEEGPAYEICNKLFNKPFFINGSDPNSSQNMSLISVRNQDNEIPALQNQAINTFCDRDTVAMRESKMDKLNISSSNKSFDLPKAYRGEGNTSLNYSSTALKISDSNIKDARKIETLSRDSINILGISVDYNNSISPKINDNSIIFQKINENATINKSNDFSVTPKLNQVKIVSSKGNFKGLQTEPLLTEVRFSQSKFEPQAHQLTQTMPCEELSELQITEPMAMQKTVEQKIVEQRNEEQRTTAQRSAEQMTAEQRNAEKRTAGQRDAEERNAEHWTVERMTSVGMNTEQVTSKANEKLNNISIDIDNLKVLSTVGRRSEEVSHCNVLLNTDESQIIEKISGNDLLHERSLVNLSERKKEPNYSMNSTSNQNKEEYGLSTNEIRKNMSRLFSFKDSEVQTPKHLLLDNDRKEEKTPGFDQFEEKIRPVASAEKFYAMISDLHQQIVDKNLMEKIDRALNVISRGDSDPVYLKNTNSSVGPISSPQILSSSVFQIGRAQLTSSNINGESLENRGWLSPSADTFKKNHESERHLKKSGVQTSDSVANKISQKIEEAKRCLPLSSLERVREPDMVQSSVRLLPVVSFNEFERGSNDFRSVLSSGSNQMEPATDNIASIININNNNNKDAFFPALNSIEKTCAAALALSKSTVPKGLLTQGSIQNIGLINQHNVIHVPGVISHSQTSNRVYPPNLNLTAQQQIQNNYADCYTDWDLLLGTGRDIIGSEMDNQKKFPFTPATASAGDPAGSIGFNHDRNRKSMDSTFAKDDNWLNNSSQNSNNSSLYQPQGIMPIGNCSFKSVSSRISKGVDSTNKSIDVCIGSNEFPKIKIEEDGSKLMDIPQMPYDQTTLETNQMGPKGIGSSLLFNFDWKPSSSEIGERGRTLGSSQASYHNPESVAQQKTQEFISSIQNFIDETITKHKEDMIRSKSTAPEGFRIATERAKSSEVSE
jgi:hypothetical protein